MSGSGKRGIRRQGSFIENKGNPLSTEPDDDESGPVQVKLQNLKDAKPISDAQLDEILKQLLTTEENEQRLEMLDDMKDPYLFKSSNLIRLVEITPSLKTKMRMLYIIGPRLVDPRAEAEYFKGMFRFSEEKSEVEEILKARVHTISTAQFNKSMGPGLLATGGRGAGAAGRGGRGASMMMGGRGGAGRGGRGGAVGSAGRGPASASQSANRSNPNLANEVRAAETASMKHRRVKSHTDSLEGVATALAADNSIADGRDEEDEDADVGHLRSGLGVSESNNSSLNSIVEVCETEEDVSAAVDGRELKPRGMSRKSSSMKYPSIKHAATMDEIKEAVENGSDSDYNSDIEKEDDETEGHGVHGHGKLEISTAKDEKQQSATGKLFGSVEGGNGKPPLNPGAAVQPSPGSITTALSMSSSGSPPGEEEIADNKKPNTNKNDNSLSTLEISSSTPENDVSVPESSSSCTSIDSPDMKGLSPLLPPLNRGGGSSPRASSVATFSGGGGAAAVGSRGTSPRPVGPSAPGSRQAGPKAPGFRQAGPTPPGSRGSSRPNSRPPSRATSPFPTDGSGLMMNPSVVKVEEKVEMDKKPGEFSNFSRVGAGSEFKKLMQTFNKNGGDNKTGGGVPAPIVIKPASSPAKKWGTVGIASKPIPTPVNTAAAVAGTTRSPRGNESREAGPLSPNSLATKSEDDQDGGRILQRKNSRLELTGTVNLKERAAAFSGQRRTERSNSHDSPSGAATASDVLPKTRKQSIAELINGSNINVRDRIASISRTNSFKLDGEENSRANGWSGKHVPPEQHMAFSPGSEKHPTLGGGGGSGGLNSISGEGVGEIERSRMMRRHSSAAGSSAVLARFNEAMRSGEFSKVDSHSKPVIPAVGVTGVDLAAQCAAVLGLDRAAFLELSPEGPLDANPPEEGPEGAVQYYTYKELVRRNYTKVYIDLKQTELEKYLLESEYESAFKVSKVSRVNCIS